MKNCKLISTAVAAILLGSSAHASGIDSFLGDAVQAQSTGGGTVSTSEGTMLYGGSFQMRAKTVHINPISVTLPHISAGCGGIDMGLGSISFLNMDQIVSILQGMMANAPGVMFEMGLKVICPSCMDTLNALEQLANQINGMNLNSCSLDKKAASWMEDQMKGSVRDGSGSDYNSVYKTFNSGVQSFEHDIGSINKWLQNEGCLPDDPSCGAKFFMTSSKDLNTSSFLEYAFKNGVSDPYFTSDYPFQNIMRYFAGDIIKTDGGSIDADKRQGTLKYIYGDAVRLYDSGNQKAIDSHARALFSFLAGVTPMEKSGGAIAIDHDGNQINLDGQTYTVIQDKYKNTLKSISGKIGTRQALSADDIKFLGMFQMPVYLMINKLAQIPSGDVILDRITDSLAKMLAYEIVYEYISRTANVISSEKAKMTPAMLKKIPFECNLETGCYGEVNKALSQMISGLHNAARIAFQLSQEASADVQKQIGKQSDLLNKINDLEKWQLVRSDPNLFNSFMYSKGLAGTGN
jgi:hypothetical protein